MHSHQKRQVERFYVELWNQHDLSHIGEILEPDFSFRGSLGRETTGHQGFTDYVNLVHAGLDDYRCIILNLVQEDDHVFARMLFTGTHNHTFMGYPPTGKQVEWHGCALFTFNSLLIHDVWVLGDLKSLEMQLQ